eukprot:TRINITY_DN878_c0_g1_i1.p1 TRINITY_DN878_c0_g1~~TRINITY_DN878_c0_g1_i1.p1  ORF type:complete len:354 (-),score=85.56 TRINITY_DN878_c0_g1_i1:6-1067(-)
MRFSGAIGDRYKEFYGAPFMGQALAEKLGCISVIISYRVGERFPAHAEDVASAIAWVYKNIAAFGGDIERFFLTGHSAGAHLVSLIALDAQYVNAVGVPISFIKGVASISGIYTLSHPMDGGFNGWANWAYRKVYIHGTFGDVVKDWELASPITYVRKIAAEILKDKVEGAESAPAPAPPSVTSTASTSSSSIETPMSPPREQKDELLTKFGDPLASPRRSGEHDEDGTKQAEEEQKEMLETSTPPIVSVIGSYKDAKNNTEHLTVDLIGSKNHYVPPFLVINAESDLGLEYDGRVFFTALGDAGLIAEYASIPTTNHATVTRSYATIEKIRDFIRRTINQLNGVEIDDLEIL